MASRLIKDKFSEFMGERLMGEKTMPRRRRRREQKSEVQKEYLIIANVKPLSLIAKREESESDQADNEANGAQGPQDKGSKDGFLDFRVDRKRNFSVSIKSSLRSGSKLENSNSDDLSRNSNDKRNFDINEKSEEFSSSSSEYDSVASFYKRIN